MEKRPLLFLKKALYEVEASSLHLSHTQLGHTVKNKLLTVDPGVCSILSF